MPGYHMRRFSVPLVIKEMQIKTMEQHCIVTGTTKIVTTDKATCWQRCGAVGIFIYCQWECKKGKKLAEFVFNQVYTYSLTQQSPF